MSATYASALLAAADLAAVRSPRAGETLRRHAHILEQCPDARREAVLAAMAVVHPELRYHALCPADRWISRERWVEAALGGTATAYPRAPIEVRARLVLGEAPARISGGLTRAEAHRWLTESPADPASDWLLSQHVDPALCHAAVRSVAVARWLCGAWADPPRRAALERHREEEGPHGEAVSGRYLDRVDELRNGDLRPGVEDTFQRAAVRMLREVERQMSRRSEPLAPAPRWWRPARCARLLLSGADLIREGRAQGHCVAAYGRYVRDGSSVIVALDVRGHRSTVEMDRRTIVVRQHRGAKNEAPPDLCARALSVLLARWRRA